jgi:pantothenate synthetase
MKELADYNADSPHGAIISSAIKLGNVRLIDNLLIGRAEEIILSK